MPAVVTGELNGTTLVLRTRSPLPAGVHQIKLDAMVSPLRLRKRTAPPTPQANIAILYTEDNGSGKLRLMVQFPTGAAQQIEIEP